MIENVTLANGEIMHQTVTFSQKRYCKKTNRGVIFGDANIISAMNCY